MSLDVYLNLKGVQNLPSGERIFIREDGGIKEVSRSEWDALHPDREPVVIDMPSDDTEVYSANITHNLSGMAREADIYEALWQPESLGIHKARELSELLHIGLQRLRFDPEKFKQFNPSNGWGNYEGLVHFIEKYLQACQRYPDADVSVSR